MYLRDHEGWSAGQFVEKVSSGLHRGESGPYAYGPNDSLVQVEFDPNRKDIEDYWLTLNFGSNDLTTEILNEFYERVRASGEA